MASTAAATTSIYRRRGFEAAVVPMNNSNKKYVNIGRKTRSNFSIRGNASEGDEISASAAATTTSTEAEEEDEGEVEVQKGPEYFINALNVEKALRGIPISDVDYYGTLGLQRGCSIDEVTVAYKKKLEEVMNEGLDEEESSKRVELLKESHSILSSVEDKRLYDWSLARKGNPETYVWPFEVDRTKTSTESPPAQEEENTEPTRLVGFFMLAWILLGATLSIALNR